MPISCFGAPGECLAAPRRAAPRVSARTHTLHLTALAFVLAATGLASNPARALEFGEALDLAEQHSPRITALRLQIDAASSAQKSAGTLPDPKLSVGLENFPISGMDRFSLSRESMTMQRLALMQEVPNRAKRDAQIAGAQARVARESAALASQRLALRQELSQAWILAQAIEQRDELLAEMLTQNQRLQDTMAVRIAGGSAAAGDLLVARQEALALADRRDDLQRDRARARSALRRWVGTRATEQLQGAPGPLSRTVEQLRSEVSRHAEIDQYPAMQAMALADVREAQAQASGDWSWEIAYSRRARQWGDMVSFQVTFDLPWQQERRQAPQTRAKQIELQRLEAEQEDLTRKHLQELDDGAAELAALDSQIERLQSSGMKLAQGRAELALSSYQAAKGDVGAVLAARTQVLETQMRLIDLQAQRNAVIARLNSLIAD
ncbi:TolC family protein [Paracidovorax citrulli]|uniref:TolC family protein n=1 Tax=Paracidovorax citrulli TaxID=80869 RepID=UPI003FA76E9A